MLDLILANLFVGLAAFIQAAVGIGFAMIAVPLLALIDLAYVPTSSLLVMLVLSVYMLVSGWADIDRAGLSTLLPGLLIGTLIAAALLPLLDGQWFGVVFGFIVLFGVALSFLGNLPLSKAGGKMALRACRWPPCRPRAVPPARCGHAASSCAA